MEKIVYIIGAGFSAHAGIPLMNNFIPKSKDIYFSNQVKYSSFGKIFEKIDELSKVKNFFRADLYNIEEVLSLFETEAILYRNTKFRNEFIQFISNVIEHYTFNDLDITLGMSNWQGYAFGNGSKSLYANFALNLFGASFHHTKNSGNITRGDLFLEGIDNHKNKYSVISLNYDLILENSLKSINDFYQPKIKFEFIKDKYNPDWEYPHLCKLHGSIDTRNIIPPTWSKNTSDPTIQKIWRNAYNILKDATQIRIIGYSLPITDNNVRFLLKSSMLKNKSLKKIDLICLDKDNKVKKNYSEFIDFNYYDFKNDKVENYLTSLHKMNSAHNNLRLDRLEDIHKSFMQEV